MSKNIETAKNLEPKEVFKYFAEISDISRGSGNTNKIVEYLVDFAIKNNLKYEKYNYNNVTIIKETSNKKKSTIALQAHIDMVCVKTDDCNKDMTKDGIDFVIDVEWLKADKTSLGADNGIGMSIILAILTNENDYERDVVGIFTNDEEIGLIGAHKIDLSNMNIKYLININHEDLDVIDVGCAGGTQLEFEKKCELFGKSGGKFLNIKVDGLIGGHFGMEITKNRGNANKILAEVFMDYKDNELELSITFDFGYNDKIIDVLSKKDTNEILSALCELPDGFVSTFKDKQEVAETSLNLGILKTKAESIYIEFFVRSNVNEKKS